MSDGELYTSSIDPYWQVSSVLTIPTAPHHNIAYYLTISYTPTIWYALPTILVFYAQQTSLILYDVAIATVTQSPSMNTEILYKLQSY